MEINEQSVNAYKTILSNPSKYGLSSRPIEEIFKTCDKVTPKHIAYNQILQDYPNLPKIFFYILADEIYEQGKAESGELGYKIEYVANPHS